MAKKKKKPELTKEDKKNLKDFEMYLRKLSKEILENPIKNIMIDGHIVKIVVFEDNKIEFVAYGNVEGLPLEEQRMLSKAETLNLLIKGAKLDYVINQN